jgi:hypothetical protein
MWIDILFMELIRRIQAKFREEGKTTRKFEKLEVELSDRKEES